MYRDEEAALAARITALEGELEELEARRRRLAARLLDKGWVPRGPHRRRLRVVALICALATVGIGLLMHFVVFRSHRQAQQAKLEPVRRKLDLLSRQLDLMAKTNDLAWTEAQRLEHRADELGKGPSRGPGFEFARFDPSDSNEAWLAVGGWACRQGNRALVDRARRNLKAEHRPMLAALCKGMGSKP